MRGLFIVLEGCDRAGKTTQTQLLQKFFHARDRKCELAKFPDRTTSLGITINSYLQGSQALSDQAIHLLFSANRWELIDSLESKVKNGVNLIVDRYAYSGAAFTSAKGLDIDWCKSCDKGLLKPDLVLFLDTSNKTMSKREDFGAEVYENLEFQSKVREQFHLLKDDSWKIINASGTIEEVQAEIQTHVLTLLNQDSYAPIQRNLWCGNE
ncbi:Thymidylate kinase [Entomophthora muscae]|uniref:Thymidylate kinase n=1 Tax=Entomophthora muscae TaxID=34485 RepID=A0ACC2SL16_9FUNG|nr:Thymidylate kinase [Entomophthora muscae]